MKLSERFAKLAEQSAEAERTIDAAATETRADVEAKIEEARRSADARAAALRGSVRAGASQAEAQWHEVQGDWDRHIARLRSRAQETKAAIDRKQALHEADWAEADATDAVAFAESAIEEAEYAVLYAVRARLDSDLLELEASES